MDMEEGNRIDNAAVERYIMHGLPGCYNKIDRQNAIILVMGNKIFISSVVDEERAVHYYPRYDVFLPTTSRSHTIGLQLTLTK